MIVYLARDIPAFVMYFFYGKSRSSLLIESTDSMIIQFYNPGGAKDRYYKVLRHISGFLNVTLPLHPMFLLLYSSFPSVFVKKTIVSRAC